jgi:hypothetical protein
MVALFAAVQMLRTDAQRKQLKGMIDRVYDAVLQIGGDPSKVQGFEFLNEEQTRAQSILSLRGIATDLMPHFLNKCWILYSTTQDRPFYISDNPIALPTKTRSEARWDCLQAAFLIAGSAFFPKGPVKRRKRLSYSAVRFSPSSRSQAYKISNRDISH